MSFFKKLFNRVTGKTEEQPKEAAAEAEVRAEEPVSEAVAHSDNSAAVKEEAPQVESSSPLWGGAGVGVHESDYQPPSDHAETVERVGAESLEAKLGPIESPTPTPAPPHRGGGKPLRQPQGFNQFRR